MNGKGLLKEYYKDEFSNWVKRVQNRGSSLEDAEDITQEAFATALKYIDTFNPNLSSIATWFTRILNQTQRKMKRDALMSVEIKEDDIFTREADDYEGDEQAKALLEKYIASENKTSHRNVLYLHFVVGMKVGDVAAQLGEPVKSVDSVVYRFKQKIKEKISVGGGV